MAAQRIACIGNSVTFGHGLQPNQTYPHNLQELVGADHQVINYGVSGSTLLKKGDKPYWNEPQYAESLRWNPNIVIIELGTNDSKEQNWQYNDEFINDYVALIRSYQQLGSSPKVYICAPPPTASNAFDIVPELVNNTIRTRIATVASLTQMPVIDLYTLLLNQESLFQDGIHPTAAGASMLANEVYRVISMH